jgi:hypothetical protein
LGDDLLEVGNPHGGESLACCLGVPQFDGHAVCVDLDYDVVGEFTMSVVVDDPSVPSSAWPVLEVVLQFLLD